MDSYKKDNPKSEGPKPPDAREPGKADSFQSSRTSPLNRLGNTRRLGSASLPADQVLEALGGEVENGDLLLGKLASRMAVLERAVAIAQHPTEVTRLLAGLSPGEAGFTRQVATALGSDAGVLRRVQVALYQWAQARAGLEAARAAWIEARQLEGREREQHVEQHCQVEKLRGQLYPLINLHVVFRDHPLISQLIPTPKAPVQSSSPPNEGGAPQAVPPRAGTGRLALPGTPGGPQASAPEAPPPPDAPSPDAAVEALKTSLRAVTGSLKNKLIDLLGGTPKEPPG